MSHYIAGRWVAGLGAAFDSVHPPTRDVIWSGHAADATQIEQAVHAAQAAQIPWAATTLEARIACLQRFCDLVAQHTRALATLITQEVGKPLWEAELEVKAILSKLAISLNAYAERTPTRIQPVGDMQMHLTHRPHGVLALLGPFNFPAHLPCGHLIPALLAGNAVVFKPSEHTPAVGEWLTRAFLSAGLPHDVIQCVQGGATVGQQLAQHPALNGLLFTGSYRVGRALHQAFAGYPEKILALEMGGNNPLIIESIPDKDKAIGVVLQSAFLTAGQRCTCARRLIVIKNPETEQWVKELTARLALVQVGAPDAHNQPFMGSLISEAACEQLLAAQAQLQAAGAKPLHRMERFSKQRATVTPGLWDCTGMQIPDEELFGPLLHLFWVNSEEQAIALANDTRYGLAASIVCKTQETFHRMGSQLKAGIINWNRPTTGAVSQGPFGGVGISGNHRPTAYYAADYCVYPVVSLQADDGSLPEINLPGIPTHANA